MTKPLQTSDCLQTADTYIGVQTHLSVSILYFISLCRQFCHSALYSAVDHILIVHHLYSHNINHFNGYLTWLIINRNHTQYNSGSQWHLLETAHNSLNSKMWSWFCLQITQFFSNTKQFLLPSFIFDQSQFPRLQTQYFSEFSPRFPLTFQVKLTGAFPWVRPQLLITSLTLFYLVFLSEVPPLFCFTVNNKTSASTVNTNQRMF